MKKKQQQKQYKKINKNIFLYNVCILDANGGIVIIIGQKEFQFTFIMICECECVALCTFMTKFYLLVLNISKPIRKNIRTARQKFLFDFSPLRLRDLLSLIYSPRKQTECLCLMEWDFCFLFLCILTLLLILSLIKSLGFSLQSDKMACATTFTVAAVHCTVCVCVCTWKFHFHRDCKQFLDFLFEITRWNTQIHCFNC